MKRLVKSIARRFGYEIRRIAPPPSPASADFLNAREAEFEPDVGDGAGRSGSPTNASNAPQQSAQATRSLIVEGWRFLPHSYAIVNQWQLLSLSRRTNLALKVLDAPLLSMRWQRQEDLFQPQAEQALRAMEVCAAGERADLMLRLFYPFDFSPSPSRQTAVFGTLEYQTIRRRQCTDYRIYEQLRRGVPPPAEVKVITPSRWSAEGFYKAGFRPEQVLVVPHGVDIGTFHPMPEFRSHIRNKISVADSDFVFLSVGAMTPNKGIDLLLRAFTEVSRKYPHARLVLKGGDTLYNSKNRLLKLLQKVPARDQQRVIGRIKYFGNSFSNRKMALLYQAADAYVSPYRAEGFNMPVLEAAASGLPILCTRGGATDDFVTDAFARRIESSRVLDSVEDQELASLEPNLEHLIALMSSATEDSSWRRQAAEAGPSHVQAHYTWDLAVDTLVRELLS